MASWRRLILFGDSLTQYSFQVGGWGSRLADELQRKVDVLNRGFSGYNTDNAVKFMKQIFPPASISVSYVISINVKQTLSVIHLFLVCRCYYYMLWS